ncbi:efflux RND transporter periplasmic adaptor subunit [Sanyastnella coralliicola]|uniref:efflux RND transporter periplasmic adaptor subunit n=1 Tax=Sanyastnella coralliicola TaxID=3069118 RepID=UPI0027B92037|nr:efflux RND transporter periplasmic adaptor subunit [Longitalea sp. SCSIO 12813]
MKNLNKNTIYIALGTLVLGLLLGWFFFGGTPENKASEHQHEQSENTIWTCSMHPQIRQPEPGQCPICGMDLIPLNNESSDEENPMEIKMSPTAMQLANVQTSVITKQKPLKEVRMNGKVKADERKISSQSSHIPGRIEKLMVSFTGEQVSKGQVLAYVYSPELVTAQEELFEAYKIKDDQPQLYQAARGKLLNWKLTEKQIDNILEAGEPQEQFPVLADVSGVVLTKKVNLGDYIKKGQTLFEVADLSKIWVLFDVYESDMPWIKKGNDVVFTIHSLPGETFKGNITFVDPVINPKTRVATARVEMTNPGMKLKPDMFAVGIVKSPIQQMKEELIVPKSAVMWTGERSVVYIKQSNASGISFMMQEIVLGPALGDSYIVKEGLEAGVEIATHGTFSIDAAAQLAGKPSMMNPEGGPVSMGHNHGGSSTNTSADHSGHSKTVAISKKAKQTLIPLFDEYLLLKDALVADDLEKGKAIAGTFLDKLGKVNMSVFKGEAHNVWMEHNSQAEKALKVITSAENIGQARKGFKDLSDQFVMMAKSFGPFDQALYIQHCPMANSNNGADWISNNKEIRNPYFGQDMLTCGEVKQKIQ